MVDYGDWLSDWSVECVVVVGCDFSELKVVYGGLVWVEFDLVSVCLCLYLWCDGVLEEFIVLDGLVCSWVYEYGGGVCCVMFDGLVWVDEIDQQVCCW